MAVRTNYELIDILTTDNDFSISATDLHNTTKVITTTPNTIQYFLHKYATRQYSVLRGNVTVTKEEAYNDFSNDFRLWVLNRQHNIDKLYQSMFDYDYSPIENVDRYENETINNGTETTYGKTDTLTGTDTTTYGKTDTTTYGKTDTRTIESATDHAGSDTTTRTGAEINETQKAGFNAPNDYTKDTKNTTTYDDVEDRTAYNSGTTENTSDSNVASGTDRLASTGSDTLSKSETNRLSGSDVVDFDSERELRVHGNIGVTSNVDLLEQEERYRLQSLAELLLDNFINDYTFYN